MKKQKIEFWKDVLDHINNSYKKERGYAYPFTGRDFKDLSHFCRIYQPWGIMALWDIYIMTANDWLIQNGLTIYQFTRSLPRLLDNKGYKGMAAAYENKLITTKPIPQDFSFLKTLGKQ